MLLHFDFSHLRSSSIPTFLSLALIVSTSVSIGEELVDEPQANLPKDQKSTEQSIEEVKAKYGELQSEHSSAKVELSQLQAENTSLTSQAENLVECIKAEMVEFNTWSENIIATARWSC